VPDKVALYARTEVTAMLTTASLFALPFFAISGILYIFVLWVMWMIVKCLKSMDASLKVIAGNSQIKS
jgi:hypothetical protein